MHVSELYGIAIEINREEYKDHRIITRKEFELFYLPAKYLRMYFF
jgi:hypothetical protein